MRDMPQLGMGSSHSDFRNGTSLSSNQFARMDQLQDMSESDMVRPIIEVYVEEATQPDPEHKKTIWYKCSDKDVQESLDKMMKAIGSEDQIARIVQKVVVTGNKFQRVLWNHEHGVIGFAAVTGRVSRVFHPTTRVLLGYLWEGQQPEVPFLESQPNLFAPWDFIHFRRMMSDDTEYGEGMLSHLYRTWRRLDMGTDQMTMYRLHTMPNRLAIEINTGSQDITTQAETVHMFAEMLRSQSNVTDGRLRNRYDPPSIESILFIPKRDAEDTAITTLPGDKDVPDVHDLEYLTKCLFGGARIPKAYVGHGDDDGGLAKSSLVTQDIRFARMIRTIRRAVVQGFLQLAEFHLAFIGKDSSLYNVEVEMSRISSVEEELNTEIIRSQVEVAGSIADLLKGLNIPNREIIELTLTNYLKLPRDFVEIAALAAEAADAAGIEGAGGGLGGGGGIGGMGGGEMNGSLDDMDMAIADGPEAGTQGALTADDVADIPDPVEESATARKIAMLVESAIPGRVINESLLVAKTGRVGPLIVPVGQVVKAQLMESRIKMARAVHDLESLTRYGKVSMVESYSRDTGFTETAWSSTKSLMESVRAERRITAFPGVDATKLLESIANCRINDLEAGEQIHESAHAIKKLRKRKV